MMKKNLMCVLAAASTVFLATNLRAEDTKLAPDASAAPKTADATDASGANRLEQMREKLNLTPEQMAKVRPILARSKVKADELRADSKLTPQERREKGRELMQAVQEEIKPILTPEQQEKWKEEAAKRRAEAQKRQQ